MIYITITELYKKDAYFSIFDEKIKGKIFVLLDEPEPIDETGFHCFMAKNTEDGEKYFFYGAKYEVVA